ncbi:MAG: hypothetical protein HY332_08840, partial [Chloroflexi bacterium]|nr:hypothetical protein [Chloroflexota bacterium]
MMTATTPIPAAPLPSGAHAGRLVRRAVLHHTAWLVPLLGAACVTGGQGARHPDRVRLLAPQHAGRQAKVAAWNERVGAAPSGRAIVELAASAPPPLPERVPVDPALLEAVAAADPQAAHLVWLPFEDLPRLARRRWLRSIGELVRRDRFDLKRFMPVALQPAYALDERLYALPEEVEARQVYFNRRHFAEAAIDVR